MPSFASDPNAYSYSSSPNNTVSFKAEMPDNVLMFADAFAESNVNWIFAIPLSFSPAGAVSDAVPDLNLNERPSVSFTDGTTIVSASTTGAVLSTL